MSKEKKLWKTMLEGMKSSKGRRTWKIGEWKKIRGKIEMCRKGFHCSERLIDAIIYVRPMIVTEVEVRGDNINQKDKQIWSEMRVIRAWEWTKKDSVSLSIYCAELCLKNFEKEFPNDDRPRKAIESAKKWLNNTTEENSIAAWSAARSAARSSAWSAAWSAARSAARSSAWSAARSAESAAMSAESAAMSAESAAWSAAMSAAWSAAWSAAMSAARSAAWAAAKEKVLDEINKWCIERLKKCKEIK